MSLSKDLSELVSEGVISSETAGKISDYYQGKNGNSSNRLLVIFGILGALLVGLGIILILAHNWDHLSRGTKTFFAFLPLVTGQVLGAYVLLKKPEDQAWKEGVSTFIFFAIGACIALVSQIYNMPGDMSSFLLTWSLLSLPLIYVLRSSMTSLLYIVGISSFAVQAGYWSYTFEYANEYWLLLAGVIPHYLLIFNNKPDGNFTLFHHWMIPLSVTLCLGTVAESSEDLLFIAYFSLFGLFYLIGTIDYFDGRRLFTNGYRIIGSLGTVILLLMLSFNWYWEEVADLWLPVSELVRAPEAYAALFLTIAAGYLLYRYLVMRPFSKVRPMALVFAVFPFIFFLLVPIGSILMNLCILAIGILTIKEGVGRYHLGMLNAGLGIIAALVICRFFDTDLSFILRGILFVMVGTGFFVANYQILRKRKSHE